MTAPTQHLHGQPPVLLRLENLRKRRGGRQGRMALDGVDLEILAGEALVLLGPNGAGKTTLLHVCAGVLRPDSGQVQVLSGGQARAPHDSVARRAIGFVPQAPAVYAQLTATENLAFFGHMLGLRGALLRERVQVGLGLAGLVERAHERASALSGGMQRRLSFACGALHAPKLLLLDEPTVGVDAESRAALYAAIDQLKAQGTTIVCSTHLPDEAVQLADRVVVMARGRVTQARSRAELLDEHATGSSLHEAMHELIVGGRKERA